MNKECFNSKVTAVARAMYGVGLGTSVKNLFLARRGAFFNKVTWYNKMSREIKRGGSNVIRSNVYQTFDVYEVIQKYLELEKVFNMKSMDANLKIESPPNKTVALLRCVETDMYNYRVGNLPSSIASRLCAITVLEAFVGSLVEDEFLNEVSVDIVHGDEIQNDLREIRTVEEFLEVILDYEVVTGKHKDALRVFTAALDSAMYKGALRLYRDENYFLIEAKVTEAEKGYAVKISFIE